MHLFRNAPGSLANAYTVIVYLQVKTRVAGRVHSLTVRDITLSEAGEVKLTAKDFQTQAQLFVKGTSNRPPTYAT